MTFRSFLEATRPDLRRPEPVHPADLQSPALAAELATLAFDVDAYDLAWQDYLSCGGFPRAVGEHTRKGEVSEAFVRDLLSWLRRDVDPDSAPQSVPLLLEQLVHNTTSPLSVRAMSETLGDSRTAMAGLLNRLVATFGALWVPRHDDHGRPVEGAQAKVYLCDPLVAWLPSRVRAGLQTPEMTALTEATLGVALASAIERLEAGRWVAGDTIGYVRTESGNEIDLGPVDLPSAAGPRASVPVESKWVDNGELPRPSRRHASGRRTGDRARHRGSPPGASKRAAVVRIRWWIGASFASSASPEPAVSGNHSRDQQPAEEDDADDRTGGVLSADEGGDRGTERGSGGTSTAIAKMNGAQTWPRRGPDDAVAVAADQ